MKSSLVVANRFLELAEQNGDALTPMQLLKLVYIAHGWMLGLYGRPLICDEVQAWQYGPVIPKLYNKTKAFGSRPITEQLGPIDDGEGGLDSSEADVVAQVYELYGKFSGAGLSRITHAEGTPWTKTYHPGTFGLVISNDLIEDHYKRLARESRI